MMDIPSPERLRLMKQVAEAMEKVYKGTPNVEAILSDSPGAITKPTPRWATHRIKP